MVQSRVLRALPLVVLALSACASPSFGALATGERLERMKRSPQFKDGIFVNELERKRGHTGKMFSRLFASTEGETPKTPPVVGV